MGIPKFYGWFVNQQIFNPTVTKNRPGQVDIFAIDGNSLIYNNVAREFAGEATMISQEEIYRRRYGVFRGVFRDIVELTRTIKPRRSLRIHIDGVPPQAKIVQQRSRRYRSASERKPTSLFDNNSITPGTDFMIELDRYIREEMARIMNMDRRNKEESENAVQHNRRPNLIQDPYADVLPSHIVYSSFLVPGEGEHKIADELRNVAADGQILVIHGADADLVMIYLMHLRNGWENIYLFRENTINYGIETIIDLRGVERVLRQLYPNVPEPVDDFVTIMFLIGNDFLPHFPVFERVYDALNTLVAGYSQFVREIHPPTQRPGANVGITTGASINWPNFSRFLEYITANYNDPLLKAWGENRDAQIKFPSLVAERCITSVTQIIGTTPQCIRTFDVSKFGPEWYQSIFSSKTGAVLFKPSQEDISDIIGSYLEGISWVYNYYRHGVQSLNVGWYYPYHYAPLFSDLYTYIDTVLNQGSGPTWESNPIHLLSDFVSPLEQLVMVLPPKSLMIMPVPLRILMGENSPIYDLFPENWVSDKQGKMEDWQAIEILPIPNPTRVIRAVASLNLPTEFTSHFDAIEPYVFNRDITQAFRVTGGSRRGRGGRAQINQPRPNRGRGVYQSRGGYQPRGGQRGGRGSQRGRGEQRGGYRPRGERGGHRGGRGTSEQLPSFNPTEVDYRRTFI